MVKLGRNQVCVLRRLCTGLRHNGTDELSEPCGEFYSGCGWVWDTTNGTLRILKSLAKHGMVTTNMRGNRVVWTATAKGWKYVTGREIGENPSIR